jgi:hypothetical protein
MFGPKKQKVEAKVSPAAVFSAAISNAVAEAQKAGVSGRTMGREFENRAEAMKMAWATSAPLHSGW